MESKDNCHYCHHEKPFNSCGCEGQIGCKHCGDVNSPKWPVKNESKKK